MTVIQQRTTVMNLFDHTNFFELENSSLRKLLEAFETSHKRHLVCDDDVDLIFSDDGADLSAVCRSARLCWARFLCKELATQLEYNVPDRAINQSVYLFTLVDIRCA